MIKDKYELFLKLILKIEAAYQLFFYDEFNDYYLCLDEIMILLDELELNNNDLCYLKNINHQIFIDRKYFNNKFENNKHRLFIKKNINNCNEKKLNFEFDLIKKYITNNYYIFNFLDNPSEKEIEELAILNPNVLYLVLKINNKMLLNVLKRNYKASAILDGYIVLDCSDASSDQFYVDDYAYKNSYITKNKTKFLKNKNIYNLYINCLKKYLSDNVLNYIHLSSCARNSIELAKYVLSINPKLLVYTGDNIKNNKEIMKDMIKIDKNNTYYLGEKLKHLKEI